MYFKLISSLLLCSLTQAQPAKILFNGVKTEIKELCFDRGHIRKIDDLSLESAMPVVKKVRLNLGHGEVFERNQFIQSKYRFYNYDTKKFDVAQIKQCGSSLVKDSKPVNEVDVTATAGEAIVYGNLKNHGINDIFNENWKKYDDFKNYIKRHGEITKVTLSENFSEKIGDIDLTSFSEWNDFSKKYVGGEQSGGGSGRVGFTLRYSSKELLRAKKKKGYLDRLLKLDTTYESVILNNETLPRIKMFVKKRD